RQSLMESMTNALFDQQPNIQRIMVISGMGGSGKTQLVLRFLRAHSESSESSIRHGMVQRVRSLGLVYARNTTEEAMEVLSKPDGEISTDWAIVFDNCDNLNINISSFFPQCDHGSIIVTTRNPQLSLLSPDAHIAVGVMSPEEGSLALLKSALADSRPSESDIKHASAIAKELEYLPVALIQAGSFIKRQRCLHTYLDKLKRNRANILKRKAIGQRDRHYHCVYDTLEVTYPELTRQCQMLLGLLSFVNYSGFSLELVHRAAGNGFRFEPVDLRDRDEQFEETIRTLHEVFIPGMVWDEQFLDDLVEELEQYSLVTRVDVYNLPTLRMHCLVSAWAHDRLSDPDKEKYLSAIVRLLISGTSEDNQDIYEFILPHLDEIPSIWGALHVNDRFGLVKMLLHGRRIDDSARIVEHISSEVIERYGQRTLRSIPAFLLQADVYWKTSDEAKKQEADSIHIKTLGILLGLVPDDHPLILEALAQRAKSLYTMDIRGEAERIQRDILRRLQNSTSGDVDFTLKVMRDLAMTCADDQVKKYDEAMKLLVAVLKKRMEIDGENHWRTLEAEQGLAKFYLNAFVRDLYDSYKDGGVTTRASFEEGVLLCQNM
ncbi:16591_t:CDS:2, partial [Acaulospora colombiana]